MQLRSSIAIRSLVAIIGASGPALVVGGACGGDTTGPNNSTPISIAVGDTIAGAFHAGDTLHDFTFDVQANHYYAIFLQATTGVVAIKVGYSGFGTPLATVAASPGSALDQRATEPFWAHIAGIPAGIRSPSAAAAHHHAPARSRIASR